MLVEEEFWVKGFTYPSCVVSATFSVSLKCVPNLQNAPLFDTHQENNVLSPVKQHAYKEKDKRGHLPLITLCMSENIPFLQTVQIFSIHQQHTLVSFEKSM